MLLRVVVLIDCVIEMVMVGVQGSMQTYQPVIATIEHLSTCVHVTQINPEITSALASGCVV